MTWQPVGSPGQVLRECSGCGLFQRVPALHPGETAFCARCKTVLRRARANTVDRSLALSFAALILLLVLSTTVLMRVSEAGIRLQIGFFAGPRELVERGMAELALAVGFVAFIAPLCILLGRIYVLVRIRETKPPRHLRYVLRLTERLVPWSMLEVLLFGVFVAYVKLAGLVTMSLGAGVYALGALTLVLVWAENALDRTAIWWMLEPERNLARPRVGWTGGRAVGCDGCGLVSPLGRATGRCPRCHSPLHHRKPAAIDRTWALVIASAILYVPANTYPVLTVMQLGSGSPSTIIGGVEELFAAGLYPLAALVFFASIAIPLLKLVGLSVLLISAQTGRSRWLRDRTRLYRVIRSIGRWSMIDIFMESLLGALVKFGNIITIEPGMGAVSFCAVVLLTILAAESFDPRLMWDSAEGAQVPAGASAPSLSEAG